MFRGMFELPQPENIDDIEGTTEDNLIKIPECFTNFEFEGLMEVMYEIPVPHKPLSPDKLLAALKLAHHWEMRGIISFIEENIGSSIQSPIEKITLGKRYQLRKLLAEGFLPLVTNTEAPTDKEIKELGWETVGQILHIREQVNRGGIRPVQVCTNDLRCIPCQSRDVGYGKLQLPAKAGQGTGFPWLICSRCGNAKIRDVHAMDWSWVYDLSESETQDLQTEAAKRIKRLLDAEYKTKQ
ncbi:hypothetical protein D9611_007815 [Ephemerocybe angulata]|uniref:Uncharacterized protein n=1 Tax=Ephemerocybe angulata TaxID=980116 RepID=A0A8H5CFR6_9AGAR|nr:hypothetical protein D9611_007815 [Tulosesus angulatus]